MMDNAKFWDKIAPKYAKDAIADMPAYEYTLERTISYLKADDRVLEMGCGTGSTALLLAPHVREIVGTDISPEMINIARGKASDGGTTNAEFRVANAKDSANLQDSFDVVLGHNLFHLVDRAEDIFADVYRMLPVGGYFISKTPCLADPAFGFKRHAIRAILPLMKWIGKAPAVRFLTHADLESALKFAGFTIVEAGNFPAISRYIVAKRV
ncbi:class I SAM-dependent methyltransferase [Octadecabacter sp. G9-8]|uniref:Class I SAM-dependent methyltransferase n=1 Tax=Octadecabacter dasysiphoniae TaxID=2909341 RepID=A0ABS9CV48_9RHOB|nr:class I SAM-dependent methyltransferase [Octadecabacter dasysiphoniae]MCF2871130.1 class I SAM-dependent methyltransferase [Octadecabacter dasysiphoniae]